MNDARQDMHHPLVDFVVIHLVQRRGDPDDLAMYARCRGQKPDYCGLRVAYICCASNQGGSLRDKVQTLS